LAVITRSTDREREQMRRSALGSDQGPTEEQQAGGSYPPGFYRQGVDPEDPTSVSFPFLRRMRRDHMVAMGLHFISMDALSAPFWFDGDDARVQAYADKLIRPIYVDLMLAIFRFFWAGYSPGVKNFKTAQPNWTYYEDGVAKKVWDNPSIDAIVYESITPLQPETAQISWDSNGRMKGIMYDSRYAPAGSTGAFIVDGKRTPNIDLLHSFWATHEKMGEDGNPYGFPRIAHCAPIFWMYRWVWDLIARGFENSFDPGPVVRFPREDASQLADDGTREDPSKTALRIGQRRRTGSTIALPSDPYKDLQDKPTGTYKWGIEYPKAETNFDSLMEFIGYLEAAKLNSLFLPEQSLAEGRGGSSSRNVAEEFGDQRSTSQNVVLEQAHRFITDVFVAPVINMVFPHYEGELTMKSIGAGGAATDLLRQVFQLVGQQDFKRFGIDMRRLAEANNFPMLDPAEQQRELEAAARVAAAAPPAVEPTQGRRALVTQTGFDEMSYHQISQRLSPVEFLSRDGDFVASLPACDAFSDATVVAHVRELRGALMRLSDHLYRDFARAVSRRRDMLVLDADSGGVDVEATIRSWVPSAEGVEPIALVIRGALGKVFDRSARQAARGVGSQHLAQGESDWLDQRAAALVGRAASVVREHVAEAVADVVAAGRADGRSVAAAVRDLVGDSLADSWASAYACAESLRAHNRAVLDVGEAAGVSKAQVVDECCDRHAQIYDLDALKLEDLSSPSCTMSVRLLPKAPDDLSVRRTELQDGLGAMYDEDSSTILIDPSAPGDQVAEFLLAMASRFR
jgi:hypothetical protein